MNTIKDRLVVSTVVFIVAMMGLAPFGSLNPTDLGFYLAILSGGIWFLLMKLYFKKTYKDDSE